MISKKDTNVIINKETHVDKDARKKGDESTDNHDPETEKQLKVVNIYRLIKVKGTENYRVTDKEFQYVTDLAKTTENLSPVNSVPQTNISVNKTKL